MPFHLRKRVLLLHASRDTPGIVERVAYGGPDGEVREGRYSNWTEKLLPILLTTGAGGEVHLRVLRTRSRPGNFLGLCERGSGCRQSAVVIDRQCNELIDGIGAEQGPPSTLDVLAEGDALNLGLGWSILTTQSLCRVARGRRWLGTREIGARGATARTQHTPRH